MASKSKYYSTFTPKKNYSTFTPSNNNTNKSTVLINPNPTYSATQKVTPVDLVNVNPTVTAAPSIGTSYTNVPITKTNNTNYTPAPNLTKPSTGASSSNVSNSTGTNYTPAPTLKPSNTGTSSNNTNVGGSLSAALGAAGGYNTAGIDLSDILAAYTASAEAQKKAISDATTNRKKLLEDTLAAQIKSLQTSESSQKESLLNSLKRFQEDTAKARDQQRSSFNANRADLEAQAFLANRAAAQSAAARGLGGSGLQQLSLLQNLINQSAQTSDLATENTEALNTLAQNLARQEEDITKNVTDLNQTTQDKIDALTTEQKNQLTTLLSEEANNLNQIETNTTSLKEQLKYQEAVRAENARIQAEQFAQQLANSNKSIASNYSLYQQQRQDELSDVEEAVRSGLASAVTNANELMNLASTSSTSKKPAKALEQNNAAVQQVYSDTLNTLASIYGGSGASQSLYNEYINQLKNYYGQYYK